MFLINQLFNCIGNTIGTHQYSISVFYTFDPQKTDFFIMMPIKLFCCFFCKLFLEYFVPVYVSVFPICDIEMSPDGECQLSGAYGASAASASAASASATFAFVCVTFILNKPAFKKKYHVRLTSGRDGVCYFFP